MEFLSAIMQDLTARTGDRLRAAELLCRMAGDFTDKVQVEDVSLLSDQELREQISAMLACDAA